MFYEEKVINGITYCRSTPTGEWRIKPKYPSTGEHLETDEIVDLQRQVHFWKQACDDAHNLGAERLKVATDALEHAEAFVNANVIGNGSGVSCLAHIRRALETLA